MLAVRESFHSYARAQGRAGCPLALAVMASNEYHFVTDWHVEGTVEEVSAIVSDSASLPRWWPSVYLAISVLEPGREDGTQKVVRLQTRGWLPYTLDNFGLEITRD